MVFTGIEYYDILVPKNRRNAIDSTKTDSQNRFTVATSTYGTCGRSGSNHSEA